MSKSKAKKEKLMLEYKKNRRNKILTIAAIVVIAAGILAGTGFAIHREMNRDPHASHSGCGPDDC